MSENLQSVLRRHHYSLTKSRGLVFDTLLTSPPLTMKELVELCDHVDRASIYRTVQLFEELGIVIRVYIGWKYKLELSDHFSDHHHHLSCTNCGRITTISESPELETTIKQLTEAGGYTMTGHQLEIHGLCPDCKN